MHAGMVGCGLVGFGRGMRMPRRKRPLTGLPIGMALLTLHEPFCASKPCLISQVYSHTKGNSLTSSPLWSHPSFCSSRRGNPSAWCK